MRNKFTPKIKKIISLAGKLPYFNFDDFAGIENDRTYLKILFSRYEKAGKLVRLKKGFYVTREYIDNAQKGGEFSFYAEFLANILYQPSYLSLDYILYGHNLLTEVPNNFTSIARNKTARFSNKFGNFFYHKIKEELFCGFEIIKKNDFTICRATRAKALFDYIYLRQNFLINEKAVEELRLNLDNLNENDLGELRKYIEIDGAKKMERIFNYGSFKSIFKKFNR